MAGSFFDELREGVRNATCAFLGTVENAVEFLLDITGNDDLFDPNPGYLGYRLLCNREPPSPPPPPFTGGQCAGVAYNITSQWQTIGDDGLPIAGTQVSWNPTGLTGPITYIGPLQSQTNPNSVNRSVLYNGGSSRINFGSLDTTGFAKTYELISASITRQDGQPDVCGDPPPIINPPLPNSNVFDVDITYTDSDNIDITIPVTITFAPSYVGGNLEINMPFNINADVDLGFNVEGVVNLSTGAINFNFGAFPRLPSTDGSCKPNDTVPDPDTPDFPDGVPNPNPNPDPNDVPTVIRGVIVTAEVDNPQATQIFQIDNPDIYAPRLGNVAFLLEFGDVRVWSEDIPVRGLRYFVRCPWEGGAVEVAGTPAPGVVWTLSPVYERSSLPLSFDPVS